MQQLFYPLTARKLWGAQNDLTRIGICMVGSESDCDGAPSYFKGHCLTSLFNGSASVALYVALETVYNIYGDV